jgi:thiol-disulfide isomerase/thioredoxin
MTIESWPARGLPSSRVLLLWFWAPWCPKCEAEAPTIAEAAKNAGNVAFVGVAAQDEVPAMQDFVDRFDLGSFPHIADTDAAVWQRFGVTYPARLRLRQLRRRHRDGDRPTRQGRTTHRLGALT